MAIRAPDGANKGCRLSQSTNLREVFKVDIHCGFIACFTKTFSCFWCYKSCVVWQKRPTVTIQVRWAFGIVFKCFVNAKVNC